VLTELLLPLAIEGPQHNLAGYCTNNIKCLGGYYALILVLRLDYSFERYFEDGSEINYKQYLPTHCGNPKCGVCQEEDRTRQQQKKNKSLQVSIAEEKSSPYCYRKARFYANERIPLWRRIWDLIHPSFIASFGNISTSSVSWLNVLKKIGFCYLPKRHVNVFALPLK
jgi:hypothetical protein